MSADIEIEIRTRIPASHMILFEVVLEGRNKLDTVDHVRLILRELFVVLPLFCVIVEPLSMAAHQCRLLCLMGFVELNFLPTLPPLVPASCGVSLVSGRNDIGAISLA